MTADGHSVEIFVHGNKGKRADILWLKHRIIDRLYGVWGKNNAHGTSRRVPVLTKIVLKKTLWHRCKFKRVTSRSILNDLGDRFETNQQSTITSMHQQAMVKATGAYCLQISTTELST